MSTQQQSRSGEVKSGDPLDLSGENHEHAAAVQSAAANETERHGIDGMNGCAVGNQVAAVSKTKIGGYSVVTEAIGGQVVQQYEAPVGADVDPPASVGVDPDVYTIGEALEAAAFSAGNKAVDESDAAAIEAAEARATGLGSVVPGSLAAEAHSAAAHNDGVSSDEQKIKIGDVLCQATRKIGGDDERKVRREDAEKVLEAEIGKKRDKATYPGGVAASMVSAARLNQ